MAQKMRIADGRGKPAGRYEVQGSGADGAAYRGIATLQPIANSTWRIECRVKGVAARGSGFVIPEGPTLVVADTIQDEIGVAA